MDNGKRYGAELLGTFLLVFFGAGTAVAALDTGGVVVVALAFGLVLLALVYVFGPVSGCHVNPAVTLGALLTGRISLPGAIGYWIAQVLGGIAAGFLIFALSHWSDVPDQTGHRAMLKTCGSAGKGRTFPVIDLLWSRARPTLARRSGRHARADCSRRGRTATRWRFAVGRGRS
ncbi:MIP/aquaporin family protein [Plantactinospora sp. DSM 117369]